MGMKSKTRIATINTYLAFGIGACVFALLVFSVIGNGALYLRSYFVRPTAPKTFNWDAYAVLLKKYVHKGLVDYKALKDSPELADAIHELEVTSPENLSDEDQGSFWLNADNLLIMKLIADKYPDIKLSTDLGNDTGTKNFIVGGKIMTAKQIDEEKVMPYVGSNWMVLFSRCTGDMTSPRLMDHPFVGSTAAADIEKNVNRFVRRRDTWEYDSDNDRLHLSKFYKWYAVQLDEDFLPVNWINHQLPPDQQMGLVLLMYDIPYDYAINDWGAVKEAQSSSGAHSDTKSGSSSGTSSGTSPGATPENTRDSDKPSGSAANGAADGAKVDEAKPVEKKNSTVGGSPPVPNVISVPGGITVPGAEKGK